MAHKSTQEPVLVIGVGNRLRGDDAAGPAVADNVRSHALPDVHVVEHSGEGASLMDAWDAGATVFLIDAAQSGGEPGFVHEFDAHDQPIPYGFFRYSTHAFSVAEAIELARVLGRLPARLHVYAIEARQFGAGNAMTPEVACAVRRVSERILARIHALNGEDADCKPCTNSAS